MRAEVELHARGRSPVHDWDARWKAGSVGILAAVLAVLGGWRPALAGLVGALLLLLLAGLPLRLVLARLGAAQVLLVPCLILLPLTFTGQPMSWGRLTISGEGLQVAGLLYLRATAILVVVMALVYTTPMVVLLGTLERWRAPRAVMNVALLTYRYLFTLWWELTRMRWALATRGFTRRGIARTHRALANVVGVSLVRSLERTERIQQAMQCRGYRGRLRTLHTFATRPADVVKAGLCVAWAVGLLAADRSWGTLPGVEFWP